MPYIPEKCSKIDLSQNPIMVVSHACHIVLEYTVEIMVSGSFQLKKKQKIKKNNVNRDKRNYGKVEELYQSGKSGNRG